MSCRPFHLAMPVRDLDECRRFYGELLGCPQGRSSNEWIDWNLFGHQLVTHLALGADGEVDQRVDGKGVPVPHFSVVLGRELRRRVEGRVDFVIEPYTRFAGEPSEQSTMFFCDPSGNALEFTAFENPDQLFAR